jgi:hypothetical protein
LNIYNPYNNVYPITVESCIIWYFCCLWKLLLSDASFYYFICSFDKFLLIKNIKNRINLEAHKKKASKRKVLMTLLLCLNFVFSRVFLLFLKRKFNLASDIENVFTFQLWSRQKYSYHFTIDPWNKICLSRLWVYNFQRGVWHFLQRNILPFWWLLSGVHSSM